MPSRSRLLGWTLLSLLFPTLACQDEGANSSHQEKGPRYDVILVTLDTTRADYLGCYNEELTKVTPNFDAFAQDAVLFDRALSTSAATPISHASILTGLNPYRHGVRVISAQSGYRLPDDIPTLATVLSDEGYRTGAILSSFTVSEYFGFERGFDTYDSGISSPSESVLTSEGENSTWDMKVHQRRSDDTSDRALDWIRNADERPSFLWLHYWDPHDLQLLPPRENVEGYLRDLPRRQTQRHAIYEAEVHYMDHHFGRVVQAVKDSGRWESTIIVVVSDHGQGLGEHDWWKHRILYEEQIRVPLIVRVPQWPTSKSVDSLVRTIDIYPTILEALGLEFPEPVEGESLRPLMEGDPNASERLAYADALNRYDYNSNVMAKRPEDDLLYCVSDSRWKLIYRYSHPQKSELYDLQEDPGELVNLFTKERDQVRRLMEDLSDRNPFVTAPFGESGPASNIRRVLEQMGYTGGDEGR